MHRALRSPSGSCCRATSRASTASHPASCGTSLLAGLLGGCVRQGADILFKGMLHNMFQHFLHRYAQVQCSNFEQDWASQTSAATKLSVPAECSASRSSRPRCAAGAQPLRTRRRTWPGFYAGASNLSLRLAHIGIHLLRAVEAFHANLYGNFSR